MEDRSTLTEDQREELLVRLDLIKIGHILAIVMLVAVIINLAWGSWQSLAITIGIIAGIAGVGTLSEGWEGSRRDLLRGIASRSRVGGRNLTVSLKEAIVFTIVTFLVAGLVHVFWWTDHPVRMVQLYLGLAAIHLLYIGRLVMERIETKLKQDQSFVATLNRYREEEPD